MMSEGQSAQMLAAALRDRCIGLMRRMIDDRPDVYHEVRWRIGRELWPWVAIMRQADGVGYEYRPGAWGEPEQLLGLPVEWADGDGLSILGSVTIDATDITDLITTE